MQYSRKSINSLLIPDINVSVTSSWANGTIRFSSELIYDSESDIIISTRTIHNFLVSKFVSKKIKRIAWEHNHHNNDKKYIKSFVNSCKKLDYVVSVSKELSNFYKDYFGNKSIYIPNC